jgi:hypothetical protein
VAHLEQIQASFLAYLGTTSGTGGTRPAAIAAIQAGGATNAQATGAMNAVQQAAFDMGAADATTYTAFATKYAALGVTRGLVMADAACDRARHEYLQANELEARLEHVRDALGTISGQQTAVNIAWSAVSGVVSGLTNGNRIVLDRLFVLGHDRMRAQLNGLLAEERRILEDLG